MSNRTSLLGVIMGDTKAARRDALTTEIKGFTIDTCMCVDTGEYETGIYHPKKYTGWVIVQQYGTDTEKAKTGHAAWVKKIEDGQTEFSNVVEYGL